MGTYNSSKGNLCFTHQLLRQEAQGENPSDTLDLVGAHLRTRVQDTDVFQCLDALRRDDVARRIVDRHGPPA